MACIIHGSSLISCHFCFISSFNKGGYDVNEALFQIRPTLSSVNYPNIAEIRRGIFTSYLNRWYRGRGNNEVRNWSCKNNQVSQGGRPNGVGALGPAPCVSKAAERFSSPTLTNWIRFGNTRNPFYPGGLIFSPTLALPAPSVAR